MTIPKVTNHHSQVLELPFPGIRITFFKTALARCSPQKGGTGCADGSVTERSPTTRRELRKWKLFVGF